MNAVARLASSILAIAPLAAGCLMVPVNTGAPAPAASSEPAAEEKAAPAPKAAAKAPELADRAIKLGNAQFGVSLPCVPKGDKVDHDDSDLGPLTFNVFECNDEVRNLGFVVMVGKFDRALPASASAATRAAKNAAAVKAMTNDACSELKDADGKCKISKPAAVGDAAEVRFTIGDHGTARALGRYPYVALVMAMSDGAPGPDAERVLSSITLPTP